MWRLGRRFKEEETFALGILGTILSLHRTLVFHIGLISHKRDEDARVGMALELLDPALGILERGLLCNIVHHNSAVCIAVVHRSQALVAFLAGRVPYFELYRVFLVAGQRLGKERSWSVLLHAPPIVLSRKSSNWSLTNRSAILDLPTDDSPSKTSLKLTMPDMVESLTHALTVNSGKLHDQPFPLATRMSRHHPYGGYDEGRRGGRSGKRSRRDRRPPPPNMYPPVAPFPMPYGYMPPAEMSFPPWPMMPGQFMPSMEFMRPPWPANPPAPAQPWGTRRERRENRERGGRRSRPRIERSVYQPDPNAERPEDSKPCRTLFVRNVTFEIDIPSFRGEFERFGAIKTFFDLIQRRGMVFVTYFDTRAAEQAKLHLNNKVFLNRALDMHYSLPREEDQQKHCDRDQNQGTLFVVAENSTVPLTDKVLLERFSIFGDVKGVRAFKDQPNAHFIEYWDSRACVAAHDQTNGSEFFGGKLSLKFAWDIETVSLVSDARNRSEAKAAAEAKARESRHSHDHSAAPAPVAAPAQPDEERLEQAQRVQQVRCC